MKDVVVLICNAKQGKIIAEAFAYESGKRTLGMTGPPVSSSIVAAPFLQWTKHFANRNMDSTHRDPLVGLSPYYS